MFISITQKIYNIKFTFDIFGKKPRNSTGCMYRLGFTQASKSTVKVLSVKNEDTCEVEALAPPILISSLNNEGG